MVEHGNCKTTGTEKKNLQNSLEKRGGKNNILGMDTHIPQKNKKERFSFSFVKFENLKKIRNALYKSNRKMGERLNFGSCVNYISFAREMNLKFTPLFSGRSNPLSTVLYLPSVCKERTHILRNILVSGRG